MSLTDTDPGELTLGEVGDLQRQLELALLEVQTHKARADAAERSRDAHARVAVEALGEVPKIRDYCAKLQEHHEGKAIELAARLQANPEAELSDDQLERRAHVAAAAALESIGLRCEAIVRRLEAEAEVAGGG